MHAHAVLVQNLCQCRNYRYGIAAGRGLRPIDDRFPYGSADYYFRAAVVLPFDSPQFAFAQPDKRGRRDGSFGKKRQDIQYLKNLVQVVSECLLRFARSTWKQCSLNRIRAVKDTFVFLRKCALAALQRMDASNGDINFRSVAAEAKVSISTAWLYRQEELRVRIMRSRKTVTQMASPASASQLRERQSRQNIVTTLRLRIKALEERNRELTEQLERAYGVIAQTQISGSV